MQPSSWQSSSASTGPARDGEIVIGRSIAGLSCNGLRCGTCAGDCDGNCEVSINELVLGVNIALDHMPVEACRATDPNESQHVTVDELVGEVQNLLSVARRTAIAIGDARSSRFPWFAVA